MKTVGFRADEALLRDLRIAVINTGLTIARLLEDATRVHLEKLEKEHEKRTGKPYVVPAHLQEN